jgi:hypothetical protein
LPRACAHAKPRAKALITVLIAHARSHKDLRTA